MPTEVLPVPIVSVCIPTYMHEKFIERAIVSASEQITDFDFEVVVSDDHSTDRTMSICTALAAGRPEMIRFVRAERNVGMDGNWRIALTACRGKYIALLDGDDYWVSNQKLQKSVDVLEAYPDCAAVCHAAELIDDSIAEGVTARTIGRLALHDSESGDWRATDWPKCGPATSSLLFRREVSDIALSNRFALVKLTEVILTFIASEIGRVHYLSESMSVYRMHAGGVFNGATNEARFSWMLELLGSLLSTCTFHTTGDRDWLRTLWDYNSVNLAVQCAQPAEFYDKLNRLAKGAWQSHSLNPWPIATACQAILDSRRREAEIRASRSFAFASHVMSMGRALRAALHR